MFSLSIKNNNLISHRLYFFFCIFKVSEPITGIERKQSKIPFRGREISPDKFIEELLELEKGDLGDEDDQVTRLAGLVLAESAKLQTPHEDIKEFDGRVKKYLNL